MNRFLLGGDFFINRSVLNIDDAMNELLGKVKFSIANLEAPVTLDATSAIKKTGPHLRISDIAVSKILHQLKISNVLLANNHIFDFGDLGVENTLNFLQKEKINYCGINKKRTGYFTVSRIDVELINCCEREWSVRADTGFSAIHFDVGRVIEFLHKSSGKNKRFICALHGGHEDFNLPSERMMRQSRQLIDAGAHLVIWHHSHCYSGMESYRGRKIYYGIGNFVFDRKNTNQYADIGILLDVAVNGGELLIQEHFIKYGREDNLLRLLQGKERLFHEARFRNLSLSIQNEDVYQRLWNDYVNSVSSRYFHMIGPFGSIKNKYLKYGIRKLKLSEFFFGKHRKLLLQSIIRCESHYEMLEELLNDNHR